MCAGGSMVAGRGILPMWLARADRLRPIRQVRDIVIRWVSELDRLHVLGGDTFAKFDLSNLGILIVRVFEPFRPTLHDPAVIFPGTFRVKRHTASDCDRSFGAQKLES